MKLSSVVGFGVSLLMLLTPAGVWGDRSEDLAVGSSNVTDFDREPIIDLLAGDSVQRIDFVATSFEGAINRIGIAVDAMFNLTEEQGIPTREAGQAIGEVIRALDEFRPRMDGYNFGPLTIVILDGDDARTLGELVGLSVMIIEDDPASRTVVQASAKKLFRGVTIDTEEGIPPLEQLLDHLRLVASLEPSKGKGYLR